MEKLDEAIRGELHRHSTEDTASDDIWAEVSQRIVRRGRRRTVRRRAVLCLSLVVPLVAAGLIVNLATNSTAPTERSVIDPAAGSGGFSVVPSSDLTNDQPVRVSIHGLRPNALVWVTMCVGSPKSFQAGENQCSAPAKTFNLNAKGDASVSLVVNRYLSPGGFEVDCATYQAGCSIALVEVDSVGSGDLIANTESVRFKMTPSAPPNPLQISSIPNGPYADGQTVSVSGSGFPSSAAVQVGECPTNTDCGGYFQTVETTPQGTFTAPVALHITYTVEQGDAGGGESPVLIDCSQPLRCFLVAEESSPPYRAASSIPLVFGPDSSGAG